MGTYTDITIIKTKLEKTKVTLMDAKGSRVVDISTIVYLEANIDCTNFYFESNPMCTSIKPLKYYEEQLKSEYFVRVHRSFIINILHVVKYNKNERFIRMSNGAGIGLSKEYQSLTLNELMITSNTSQGSKLPINNKDEFEFVDVSNVLYLKSNLKLTSVYLKNGQKITSNISLKKYEELLKDTLFKRASRNYIVNLSFVQRLYDNTDKPSLSMSDNYIIELEGRHRDIILGIFDPAHHQKLRK